MKKFVIQKLGQPFDGLIVHVSEEFLKSRDGLAMLHRYGSLVPICRIQNDHTLFNSFSLPVREECMYIKATCLVEHEEHEDDQLTSNPYGEYICDGNMSKGDVNVTWAKYHDALTVKIVQNDNTLYSHNFIGHRETDFTYRPKCVKDFLDGVVSDSEYDWDNLIFDLSELE